LVLAAGCGRAPAPAGTGAREAAELFGAALCRRDWPAAYRALHPDSRKECGPELFAERAANHCAAFGFRPERVVVRFCEEHGREAIAQVVFLGTRSRQRAKDAFVLHRQGESWGVVLEDTFGNGHR
jgi:hypothetical protein